MNEIGDFKCRQRLDLPEAEGLAMEAEVALTPIPEYVGPLIEIYGY